jgi:hypothetical protein
MQEDKLILESVERMRQVGADLSINEKKKNKRRRRKSDKEKHIL